MTSGTRLTALTTLGLAVVVLSFAALAASADDPKAADDPPRRMLVVQVHQYAYFNPLTASSPAKNRAAIDRLALALHVPTWRTNNQLFVLSDTVPPPEERVPVKSAIVAGVRRFCETSRAQDRILLYFRGQAVEKNKLAYFAPAEGDPGDVKTLVPVADLYEQLKTCRATQKVVVWDVCPRNPDRAPVRMGSVPLGLDLYVALMKVPAGSGIQVVTPCLPGENSLEYEAPKDPKNLPGSVLFDAVRRAIDEIPAAKRFDPASAIPIVEAFPAIEKYTTAAATALWAKQTPQLFGNLPPTLTPPNPLEPLPSGVHFPVPHSPAAVPVRAILQELALPPTVIGVRADPLPALPFDPDVLKLYLPDVSLDDIARDSDKYPLRIAVLHALQTMRDTHAALAAKETKPLAFVPFPVTDPFKRTVQIAQDPLAEALAKLDPELKALEAVANQRDKETKRWQAHFNYALGQLHLRLAVLSEYNLVLGNVRTETLPELPDGSTGWRLVPSDKLTNRKDAQEHLDAARAAFGAIATADKGTPWEMLVKRALLTPPGFRWEPVAR